MENKKLTWKHYLGIAVVAVLVIYLVIGFSFSNKFFWGTKINGMNVAGKTADQVIINGQGKKRQDRDINK